MNMKTIGGTALMMVSVALGVACAKQPPAASQAASAPATPAPPAAAATQNPGADSQRVSVAELKRLVAEDKVMIIDVRTPDAYKAEHIRGAVYYALDKLQSGDFKGLPRDKRIIAYCACPTEATSAQAAQALAKAGFKDPAALVGGIHGWESAGGEVVKNSTEPAPAKKGKNE
jgi:rhodanese-related sulfurtransferase